MAINISWIGDANSQIQKFELYRSTTKADLYQAGNLLTTISDPLIRAFQDVTATNDTIYFYGVITYTELGPVMSDVIIGRNVVNKTGPGSSSVRAGTLSDGLFERLDPNRYLHLQNLWRRLSDEHLVVSGVSNNPRTDVALILPGFTPSISKIASNGNILFFLEDPRTQLVGTAATMKTTVQQKFINATQTVSTELYDFTARLMTDKEFTDYQMCFGGQGNELRFLTQAMSKLGGYGWIVNRDGQAVFAIIAADGSVSYVDNSPSGNGIIPALVLIPS